MTNRPATEQVLLTVTASEEGSVAEPDCWINSSALDRMRDRVRAEGAVVDGFLRNPQVNYGHPGGAYDALPVATATSLQRVGDRWRMRWRWLENDPFADRVRNAWNQGVLRAASIEFIPLASEPNAEGGRDYTRWELVGVALCAVPANPEAVRTCKALGLPVGQSSAPIVIVDNTIKAPAEWGMLLRDDAPIIDLDDEEIDLDARDVIEAVRLIVPQLAAAEVARQRGRLDEIDVDGIDGSFDPLTSDTDRRKLLEALGVTIPALVRREIDKLRGRISDD